MIARLGVATVAIVLALGCAGGSSEQAPAPAAPPAPTATAPTPAAPAPTAAPASASPVSAATEGERPLYYDRALTDADLQGRTLRELALMRNTIFARTGHPFVKPWLDQYFRAQRWYRPQEKGDLTKLTDYDRANVAKIAEAENAIPRSELVTRRDAIRARGATGPNDVVELALLGAALGEYSGDAAVPKERRNPLEDPSVLDGQLTLAQIEGMSRRDLRLLRNTIYARHGRPFQSPVLQQYFADKAWYSAKSAFRESQLTDVDKRNIQLVQSMEDRLGGPMREWEHQKEEGWFEGA